MAKSKKKKATKKAALKTSPSLEQLRETAKDLNKFMDDINDGNYDNPIDLGKEDASYFAEQIVGMVKEELYKQDKDSLTVDSIAVILELGVNFETLRDDPEQAGEENGRNGKEEPNPEDEEKPVKAPAKKAKGKIEKTVGKTVFGHKLGSASGLLDELLIKGITQEQSGKEILKKFPEANEKYAGTRIKEHVRNLLKDGIQVDFDQNTRIYKVKGEK